MKKPSIITDISEEDFRKLDVVVYKAVHAVTPDGLKHFTYRPVHANDILDKEIGAILEFGYEEGKEELSVPFTLALHSDNSVNLEGKYTLTGYWDKYMDMFAGGNTYEFATGIEHLYSTRDYYQARGDYWKVSKKETKKIYRILPDPKWRERFVLKHRKEVRQIGKNTFIEECFELDPSTDKFVLRARYTVVYGENGMTEYIPMKI